MGTIAPSHISYKFRFHQAHARAYKFSTRWVRVGEVRVSRIPDALKFTNNHEWVRIDEDDVATIGITDYAQTLLGELVYVELPDVGDVISKGEDCGVVESVMSSSDVYCPVTGQVVETNDSLAESPGIVNASPYIDGWLFRIQLDKPAQIEELLDPEAYQKQVAGEAH